MVLAIAHPASVLLVGLLLLQSGNLTVVSGRPAGAIASTDVLGTSQVSGEARDDLSGGSRAASAVPHALGNPTPAASDSSRSYALTLTTLLTPPVYTIPVGRDPEWETYDPTNGFIYVSNHATQNVSVINGTKVVASVAVPRGGDPQASAFDAGNGFVYVPDLAENVTVIDGMNLVAHVKIGSFPLVIPSQAVYDSWNHFMYVINCCQSPILTVMNGTKVIANITVPSQSSSGVFDSRNGWIYVVASSTVTVINGTSVVATVVLGSGNYQSVYDPVNGYVYEANSTGVVVLDGTSVISVLDLGSTTCYLTVDSADGYVYASECLSGILGIIDGTRLLANISVGAANQGTFDPENGEVYVSGALDEVHVIRGLSVIGTIDVGMWPTVLAYDPTNHFLYVADSGAPPNGTNVSAILTGFPTAFTETGLPSGSAWSVNLSGELRSSTSAQLDFLELNGSYSFSVQGPPGYEALPPSGSLSVNGSGSNESIRFLKTFTATFTENGLPTGTDWRLNVSGSAIGPSSTASLSWAAPNGSYTYAAFSSDPTYASSGGSFAVQGGPVSVGVLFSRVTFNVSFSELGLPNGTNWSVELGGLTTSSSTSTIAFPEPNGTFAFRLGAVPGWTTSRFADSIVVNGSATTIQVIWTIVAYSTTLVESGLPAGTEWWVNASGGSLGSSSSSTLGISEPNGTYFYAVGVLDKTYAVPAGYFTIAGQAVLIHLAFSRVTFTVTFVEVGLPTGTNWSVTFGSQRSVVPAPTSVSFGEVLNGSYPYAVALVTGYSASPYEGSLVVHGGTITERIEFASTGGPGGPGNSPTVLGLPPAEGYALLLGLLAMAILGTVVVLIVRRRGHQPEELAERARIPHSIATADDSTREDGTE